MLKSDLHIHTHEDAKDAHIKYTAKELILCAENLNFEVLSITHHQARFFSQEIKSYAKKHNILLLPGTEAKIEGKEVLIINMPDIKQPKTFKDLERLKEENTIIIAPHPFYPRGNCLQDDLIKNISLFDGIEYSHFYTSLINFNKKAEKTAKKYSLPLIGTSDAHSFEQMNHTFTLIDSEKNTDAVLEAIRKKKTHLVTEPLSASLFLKIASCSFKSVINRFIRNKQKHL